jgi:DNA polymerase-1
MIYIQEALELEKHIRKLDNKPVVGGDTETEGLCPYKDKLRLLQLSDGENTLVIDAKKIGYEATAHYVRPILESKNTVKVFHNAKFDQKFIKQQLKIDIERPFDTFLSSQMIEGGIRQERGYHGLEKTLNRYTDITVTKDEQISDWSGELSESQIAYAAKDAECLLPLRESIIPVLQKLGLIRCAKLEFDAILPIVWLELSGFYLDFEQWMQYAHQNLIKSQEAASKIYELLKPVMPQDSLFGESMINLDSTPQIKQYFTALGVPLPKTEDDKVQTREYLLAPLAKEYPIIQYLLDYRGYNKAYNTFGESFKDFINPITGRVHSDFFQIGAETGRLAPNNPNLNQIPADAGHRNCFKAEEGNTLTWNDYSQEELRILADFSGDKKFKGMFASGYDFHQATAANIFHIPIEQVTHEYRTIAKRLNFGLTYGIGVKKFALQAGITPAEARIVRDTYFNTFKTVNRWINFQKVKVLQTRSARTASGRLMNYEFDEGNSMETSKAQRNAVNGPIQGTGADVLKRALKIFYDASKPYHDNLKLVNVIHDEIIVETRKDMAEEMRDLLSKCMIEAGSEFIKTVDVKVDSKISDFWYKD